MRGHKIHGTVGDADPIEWGGGVVFRVTEGRDYAGRKMKPYYVVEYTDGLDWEGADPERMEVYRVPVEPDFFGWNDWVDVDDVADSIGIDAAALARLGRSRTVMDRVEALIAVAGYYGWHELDSYPLTLSSDEIEERWEL